MITIKVLLVQIHDHSLCAYRGTASTTLGTDLYLGLLPGLLFSLSTANASPAWPPPSALAFVAFFLTFFCTRVPWCSHSQMCLSVADIA